ncbi:hypothetical protein CXP39_01090 [Mesoplasma syrphidae]|uniref:DUF3899 domain-containing protein n=1 Tax=Mesoplasma syrphidae TaxID=225999 RepID=A0A2K9BUL2_9MOLU|nr:hypothetical protein [Mesoplasma syrphidae]AUF83400.1 hypothetical protein CXP39_01090 [Mesoplasma syrphidae]
MSKNKSSNSSSRKINKEISEFRKNSIKQQINEKIDRHEAKSDYKHIKFLSAKKLRWYDYLTIVFVSAIYIAIAILINQFAFDSSKNYIEILFTTGFLIFLALFLLNGFIRNKRTAKYFNNTFKRYDSTLDEQEGLSRRISKIFILISTILFVAMLISLLV